MGTYDQALVKALMGEGYEDLHKAHIHAYVSHSKTGKLIMVQDHEDSRVKHDPNEKEEKPAGGMRRAEFNNGSLTPRDGHPIPQHISDLKIPPAWKNISFNPDPNADLQVKGMDSKGRTQYIYSESFKNTKAEEKFARIDELFNKFDEIKKENKKATKDGKLKEAAECLELIMATGIRPGSDKDTQAKVKAYGATTLEGKHVAERDGTVTLEFVGKKGVSLTIPIQDEKVAKMILKRKKAAGEDGKLFKTTAEDLLEHTRSLDGKIFKTKNFRTYKGTHLATELVQKMDRPKNEKEYKKAVKAVAKAVSEKLGNTPTVALQSYINPVVFAEWRI